MSTLPTVSPDQTLGATNMQSADVSPVAWQGKNGKPVMSESGNPLTQDRYEGLVRMAETGQLKDRGINSKADLDNYLTSLGAVKVSPTERRGLSVLNGGSTTSADVPPESADVDIVPPASTPKNSPEKYTAPAFTDETNGTTEDDMQKYLDALNGYERGELTELDIWELNRKYQKIMKYGSGVDSESTPFFRRETGRWRPVIM